MAEMTPEQQAAWMRQWRSAAIALAEDERARLAALTTEEAFALSETVLALAPPVSPDDPRYTWSGLVEQQALFRRLPRR